MTCWKENCPGLDRKGKSRKSVSQEVMVIDVHSVHGAIYWRQEIGMRTSRFPAYLFQSECFLSFCMLGVVKSEVCSNLKLCIPSHELEHV